MKRPKNTRNAKDFKRESATRRNVSKHVSKGISRLKKPSPALKKLIELANTAPRAEDVYRIYEDDEVLKELRQRGNTLKDAQGRPDHPSYEELSKLSAAYHNRETELQERADRMLALVRHRDLFLNVIELAKRMEIQYLKQCESCGNIFFAGRSDQAGCSPACLNKIRRDRWNKNYAAAKAGERRGYLKPTKKRAKTASKR